MLQFFEVMAYQDLQWRPSLLLHEFACSKMMLTGPNVVNWHYQPSERQKEIHRPCHFVKSFSFEYDTQ